MNACTVSREGQEYAVCHFVCLRELLIKFLITWRSCANKWELLVWFWKENLPAAVHFFLWAHSLAVIHTLLLIFNQRLTGKSSGPAWRPWWNTCALATGCSVFRCDPWNRGIWYISLLHWTLPAISIIDTYSFKHWIKLSKIRALEADSPYCTHKALKKMWAKAYCIPDN